MQNESSIVYSNMSTHPAAVYFSNEDYCRHNLIFLHSMLNLSSYEIVQCANDREGNQTEKSDLYI